MITILDYGMGNLRSVQKAFEAVGASAVITDDAKADCERMVLPGVGAIRDAMARMKQTGLDDAVRRHIEKGRPFLGICLGLQLLFERSHEDGEHTGLGILSGDVVKFTPQPGLKIPHMGWNQVTPRIPNPLLDRVAEFYFVHSYFARPAGQVVAGVTDYGGEFASLISQDNIQAVQFHPEKSQRAGLQMLANFAKLT